MTTSCCANELVAGDRVLVLHAGEERGIDDPVWPDQVLRAADPCGDSDWAHWSSWATTRGLDVVGIDVALGDGCPVAALSHLLWVDPSIRAVLVAGEARAAGTDIGAVRDAMALTGSRALLLVDSMGTTVRSS